MKAKGHKLVYRIRNTKTGQFLHESLFKILEFDNVYGAYKYLRQHGLDDRIYHVERIN